MAIPHQVFYDRAEAGKPYVRWAFCKQEQVLDEAIRRLGALRKARLSTPGCRQAQRDSSSGEVPQAATGLRRLLGIRRR